MKREDLAKEYYKRAYKLFKLINADGFAEMMLKKIKEQEQPEKQSET
jgi:hypothetical protein